MTTYNLNGPGGNVFALMSQAKRWCRQLDEDFAPIEAEMKAGDYAHAVDTMRKHFGEFVDFSGGDDDV